MELLKSMTSPLRKREAYSSKKHLVDAEISSYNEEDEITNIIVIKQEASTKKYASYELDKDFELKTIEIHKPDIHDTDIDHENSEKSHLDTISLTCDNDEQQISSKCSNSLKDNNVNTVISLKKNETSPNDNENSLVNSSGQSSSDCIELIKPKDQKHKKNKKEKRAKENESIIIQNVPISPPRIIEKEQMEIKSTDEELYNVLSELKMMGIHIHKSDILKNHPFVCNPVVKIHVVNYETGIFLSYNEQKEMEISTKPFDFSKKRTIAPQWNEFVMFDGDILSKMKSHSNIIIFFEIINKGISNVAPIAWAFLKIYCGNDRHNINKKIKLQLYEPLELDNTTGSIKIYESWKRKPWKIYPSILYITLKGFKHLDSQEFVINMKSMNFDWIKIQNNIKNIADTNKTKTMEERLNNQQCKLPNVIEKSLLINKKGSFVLKFSKCGKYLASACNDNENFTIFIFKVPEFTQEAKLIKHKSIIYDICWNNSGTQIISASSDSTVCVWETDSFLLSQQLVHSSFVYTAQFSTVCDSIMATGCYDKIVRIWNNEDNKFTIQQELNGHEGFVNTICFSKKSDAFYSGDSVGLIIKWNKENDEWKKIITIKCLEIIGNIINDLIIFPDNQRILIVLRNSAPRSLDIATSSLFLCYTFAINYRYQMRGCVSPCGSFVMVGNCVWNAVTGDLLAMYDPSLYNHHPITALDYHPFYHIIAMTCGFLNTPLFICTHKDDKITDSILNLELFANEQASAENATVDNNFKDNKKKSHNTMVQKENYMTESLKFKEEYKTEIHSSKLWQLISKMDRVLLNAKKFHKYEVSADQTKEIKYIKNDKINKLDSESNGTFTLDLTQFNQKIVDADISKYIKNKNDASLSDGTYTIKEDKKMLQNDNYTLLPEVKLNNDDASTLSAAESLEEDV